MKINCLCIFTLVVSIQTTTAANGQSINFSISDGQLTEVFDELQKQSDYRFLYSEKMMKDAKSVTVSFKQTPILEAIAVCFKGQPLEYTINNKTVIVRHAAFRFPDEPVVTFPVKGKITDSKNVPLEGVTVNIKGTSQTVVTNAEGNYAIEVPDESSVLVFSHVGFISQEISVKGRQTLSLILAASTAGLNEVVVIGYGTSDKKSLTGSVATIKGDVIKAIPVGNVGNTLAGRLPGLIAVNTNGEPGYDGSELSIRGFANMLIIVDGIPNSLNRLDPNEIESISVLKDASASIYGARAGNGVILVTTKRGNNGPPKFAFTASNGYQSPTVVNENVDAATYATVVNDLEILAGRTPIYSDEEVEKYRNGTDPNYPNTNWRDEVMRKWAPLNQYNLNASGGADQIKYFLSLGYVDQGSMLRTNAINYKRYNIRSNIDSKISKDFSVSLDFAATIEQRNSPGAGPINMRSYGATPLDPILGDIDASFPIYAAHLPDPSKIAFAGSLGRNPLASTDPSISGYNKDNRKNILAQFNLKYNVPFIKGLSARAAFSYTTQYDYVKAWRKQYSVYDYNYTSQEYSLVTTVGKNLLNESLEKSEAITNQLFLNYDRKWKSHKLSAMVLGEFIKSDGNYFNAYREGFISTAIDQLFAGEDLNKNNDGSAYQDGRIGYAGRLNYDFAGKYLAEATFRYDASARFIDKARWGFFPSLSLGWRISEENFMKGIRGIDQLKLRVSHGRAGNDYVGNFNFLTGYQFNKTPVFGETPVLYKGIVSKGLANPDLTWEKTATSNLGIEASFFKGLIGFEFDLFYRKVTDVPGYRSLSLPYNYGATLPQENINSFDDRGFELLIRHKNNIGKFNYAVEGNMSWARSKWDHYDEPVFPDDETRRRLQQSGQWKNRWFGYKSLGLFQSQREIDEWPIDQDLQGNITLQPGDIKYLDYNKDGQLDSRDEYVVGRGFTPEIMFGLNLSATFKNFDLSILWQGATNYNAYFGAFTTYSSFSTPYKLEFDRWTPETPNAKFPRLVPGGSQNNGLESTYWLQNGTYVRLKNIQFGYTFSKGLLTKVGIDAFKLYIGGFNLITFTKVYYLDPEIGLADRTKYPQQKAFNVGVNLNF